MDFQNAFSLIRFKDSVIARYKQQRAILNHFTMAIGVRIG
tara:strand:- start:711 stop:830 length:120 start_codon:yes stop_codon:yes gene_type:complete